MLLILLLLSVFVLPANFPRVTLIWMDKSLKVSQMKTLEILLQVG